MWAERRRAWIVTAVCAVVAVCVGTAVLIAVRSDSETNARGDCGVVTELITQWRDEIDAAVQKLADSTNGREDTLALADKEAQLAEMIRAGAGDVESAEIARDLERWAVGADQLAHVHRDQIYKPNPDVSAPPPADYLQGSVAINQATSNLVVVCPSAGPNGANS